jgi:hypothetical protein
MSHNHEKLNGIVLANASTPVWCSTLAVQRVAHDAMSRGHRVLASKTFAKVDSTTSKRYPRVLSASNPRLIPSEVFLDSEASVVSVTPWIVDERTYIFVVEG